MIIDFRGGGGGSGSGATADTQVRKFLTENVTYKWNGFIYSLDFNSVRAKVGVAGTTDYLELGGNNVDLSIEDITNATNDRIDVTNSNVTSLSGEVNQFDARITTNASNIATNASNIAANLASQTTYNSANDDNIDGLTLICKSLTFKVSDATVGGVTYALALLPQVATRKTAISVSDYYEVPARITASPTVTFLWP